MQEILNSLSYVIHGNMFWQSMGMTTATALFIGAMLFHESNKSNFYKAVVTVMIYSIFLIFTSAARVSPNVSDGIVTAKTYAAVITISLITTAYALGLIIGYCLLRRKNVPPE